MARHQREDVSRHGYVVWTFGRVDRHRDRMGAVVRRNAGRNSFLRLDRHRERGLLGSAVELRHHRNAQRVRTLLCECETDEPAAIPGHEIYRLRRAHLRRNHEVAFILSVFCVDENEHAPVAGVLDQLLH